MSTIENYSSRKARQVQKGTIENPYTEEEYEAMLDAGTWTGGYVEGLGYCGTNVIIDYDSSSFSSSFSNSSDPEGSEDEPSDGSPLIDPNDHSGSTENDEGAGGNGNTGGNTNSGTGTAGSGSDGTSTGGCTTESSAIPDLGSKVTFYGYKTATGCLDRCKEMLSSAHCQLSGAEIVMAIYSSDGRAVSPVSNYSFGIDYIDSQLRAGNPVIVYVDYKTGRSTGPERQDKAGDHAIIIVGGNSTTGYHFYDPATSLIYKGTSSNNLLTMSNGMLQCSSYCMTGQQYILSSIRKNN